MQNVYQIIYLLRGQVVQINSYEDEASRDEMYRFSVSTPTPAFDDVQILDEVK